jgi:hypothetical protein
MEVALSLDVINTASATARSIDGSIAKEGTR